VTKACKELEVVTESPELMVMKVLVDLMESMVATVQMVNRVFPVRLVLTVTEAKLESLVLKVHVVTLERVESTRKEPKVTVVLMDWTAPKVHPVSMDYRERKVILV
jgi:hypothetical protein